LLRDDALDDVRDAGGEVRSTDLRRADGHDERRDQQL
jgi:hypothetical protein